MQLARELREDEVGRVAVAALRRRLGEESVDLHDGDALGLDHALVRGRGGERLLPHAPLDVAEDELAQCAEPRAWRDAGEMWARCGRDVGEMWARCGRDVGEIWARYRGSTRSLHGS